MTRNRVQPIIGFAIGAAALVGASRGQDAVPAELLARLDEGGFVERELATRELETSPSFTLGDLETMLENPDLTPEQRRRLTGAARRRFFIEPRAAMGIMLGAMTDLGLTINGTTPGFPSTRVLRAEDIITVINHVGIRSTADLQVAIISASPGDVVPVEFIRNNRTQQAELELGSWADLGGQPAPSYDVLLLAWQQRTRQRRDTIDPPGVPGLLLERLPGAGEGEPSLPGAELPRETRRERPVIGGEPRDAAARAAGIALNRRLSQSAEERGSDYSRQLSEKLLDLEQRASDTRKRLEIARANLARSRERGDQRRIDDYQAQVDQHTRVLRLIEDNIRRAEAARDRVSPR